jgi:hypothetical protein
MFDWKKYHFYSYYETRVTQLSEVISALFNVVMSNQLLILHLLLGY